MEAAPSTAHVPLSRGKRYAGALCVAILVACGGLLAPAIWNARMAARRSADL
jgi:hypothetical protein